MEESTTGLILCGGASRRMGTEKARLGIPQPDGTEQPLVECVARVLEPLCGELLFACGTTPKLEDIAGDRSARVPRRIVLDAEADLGPLAGLSAGLDAARGEWVLVSACDLPRLDGALYRRLLRKALETRLDVCLFVGRSDPDQAARWHPSIGVYRRELAGCVRRTLALGGRRWIDFHEVPLDDGSAPRVGTLSERDLPRAPSHAPARPQPERLGVLPCGAARARFGCARRCPGSSGRGDRGMSVPAELTALLGSVEPGLEKMRAVMTAQLEDASPAVGDLTTHVGRFRGKQLRGALVLLVGKATGNQHEELPQVAAVVELIHLATLVHDDILDGAEVRRRVACINQRWDNQVAVLLGDFLYARAFSLSTDLSSSLASRLLSETTRKLCVGEIEQSARRYDFDQPAEQIERVAAAKTASLYSASAELGARYPDGDSKTAESMAAFGHELGLAFQLVDDCLDLVGDREVLGKSVGTDVEDGKVTLPVSIAYAKADDKTRARMRDLFTLPGLEDRAKRLRLECDLEAGVSRTLGRARELVESARARLLELPAGPARSALEDLSAFVLARRS